MTDEVVSALKVIREACASVTANLGTHQAIQTSIATVETALLARVDKTPASAPKEPVAAK